MKLKEILSINTDPNQTFIVSKEIDRNFVQEVARKTNSNDTTAKYLENEVIKMHATTYGDIVLRVE